MVQHWIKSEDHVFHVRFAKMVSTTLCDEAFSVSAGYALVPALTMFHFSLFGTVFNDCFTLNDPIDRKQVDTELFSSFMIFCLRQMCSEEPEYSRHFMMIPVRSIWYELAPAVFNKY